MHNLTQRQVEILRSLIEEYIETASPVGSETLEKKHNLSASPATIRNEMVALTKLGYLKKPHTSAGRVPTPEGIKFYVDQLMKEKQLSLAEEVAVKEKLWDYRENAQRFMKTLTKSLAEKTKMLAVCTTEDGDMYCAGYANILDLPEFYDIDVTKGLLAVMDEMEYFSNILSSVTEEKDVHVLMGDELGPRLRGPYSLVFTHYETPMHFAGDVGVFGPTRLNYNAVIPTVRYFGDLVEQIAKGW